MRIRTILNFGKFSGNGIFFRKSLIVGVLINGWLGKKLLTSSTIRDGREDLPNSPPNQIPHFICKEASNNIMSRIVSTVKSLFIFYLPFHMYDF